MGFYKVWGISKVELKVIQLRALIVYVYDRN
jgi:hypothetical protein